MFAHLSTTSNKRCTITPAPCLSIPTPALPTCRSSSSPGGSSLLGGVNSGAADCLTHVTHVVRLASAAAVAALPLVEAVEASSVAARPASAMPTDMARVVNQPWSRESWQSQHVTERCWLVTCFQQRPLTAPRQQRSRHWQGGGSLTKALWRMCCGQHQPRRVAAEVPWLQQEHL